MRTFPLNMIAGSMGSQLGSYLSSGSYSGRAFGFIGGYLTAELVQYLSQFVDDRDLRIRIKLAASITVGLVTDALVDNHVIMAIAVYTTMKIVNVIMPPPPLLFNDIFGDRPANDPHDNNENNNNNLGHAPRN